MRRLIVLACVLLLAGCSTAPRPQERNCLIEHFDTSTPAGVDAFTGCFAYNVGIENGQIGSLQAGPYFNPTPLGSWLNPVYTAPAIY